MGLPQMVHKFYTIKNEKSIHAGTIISTLFALVIAGGSYFMGAFGRLYYTVPEGGKPVFDNIVPQMLASSLPDLLIGVVMILVLSASMSTLSSLVITSSSTFTLDFLKGVFMKDMTHKVQLRWIPAALHLLRRAVGRARPQPQQPHHLPHVPLVGRAGGRLPRALHPRALLAGRDHRERVGELRRSASASACGTSSSPSPRRPRRARSRSSPSLVITPLVSLVTPKLSQPHLDVTFSCYDEKVAAPHKFVLNPISE